MSDEGRLRIGSDTQLQVSPANFSSEDIERLEDLGIIEEISIRGQGGPAGRRVERVEFDLQSIRELTYEYQLLSQVASQVETQILKYFRSSPETTLTTSEIAEEINRPKTSVSRSLGKLVDKDQLSKVQSGVYRRKK